jgi:hypothetical protein
MSGPSVEIKRDTVVTHEIDGPSVAASSARTIWIIIRFMVEESTRMHLTKNRIITRVKYEGMPADVDGWAGRKAVLGMVGAHLKKTERRINYLSGRLMGDTLLVSDTLLQAGKQSWVNQILI